MLFPKQSSHPSTISASSVCRSQHTIFRQDRQKLTASERSIDSLLDDPYQDNQTCDPRAQVKQCYDQRLQSFAWIGIENWHSRRTAWHRARCFAWSRHPAAQRCSVIAQSHRGIWDIYEASPTILRHVQYLGWVFPTTGVLCSKTIESVFAGETPRKPQCTCSARQTCFPSSQLTRRTESILRVKQCALRNANQGSK